MEKQITIFHGSEKIVEHPVFGDGKRTMILALVSIVQPAKILRKSGLFLLCEMDLQIVIH